MVKVALHSYNKMQIKMIDTTILKAAKNISALLQAWLSLA